MSQVTVSITLSKTFNVLGNVGNEITPDSFRILHILPDTILNLVSEGKNQPDIVKKDCKDWHVDELTTIVENG